MTRPSGGFLRCGRDWLCISAVSRKLISLRALSDSCQDTLPCVRYDASARLYVTGTEPSTTSGITEDAAITTIAYRDGVLAADSLATDDDCAIQVHKIARLPNGDVAGGSGTLGEVALAVRWLAGRKKGQPPSIDGASILFTIDGVLHLADGGWPGVRVKGYAAVGSGAQGALVAMKLGKSAKDAVIAVAGVDHRTGGEIDVLAYSKPKGKKR